VIIAVSCRPRLVVGAFFGWTLVRALHSKGITEFRLPVATLLGFVLAAAVAGISPPSSPPAEPQNRYTSRDHHRMSSEALAYQDALTMPPRTNRDNAPWVASARPHRQRRGEVTGLQRVRPTAIAMTSRRSRSRIVDIHNVLIT
jgi:hypothetical protein